MRSTSIPIEIINLEHEGNHPKVTILICGKPADFILDTGASKTVIDRAQISILVNEIQIIASDQLSTGLGTNEMESYTAVIPEICIGELKIINFESAVLDLSHINHAYERINHKPILGVLGNEIFLQYEAIIDYKRKWLQLFF